MVPPFIIRKLNYFFIVFPLKILSIRSSVIEGQLVIPSFGSNCEEYIIRRISQGHQILVITHPIRKWCIQPKTNKKLRKLVFVVLVGDFSKSVNYHPIFNPIVVCWFNRISLLLRVSLGIDVVFIFWILCSDKHGKLLIIVDVAIVIFGCKTNDPF
jgi:hypothetical protein